MGRDERNELRFRGNRVTQTVEFVSAKTVPFSTITFVNRKLYFSYDNFLLFCYDYFALIIYLIFYYLIYEV